MVDGKTKIDNGDIWCDCQINSRNDSKSGVFSDFEVGEVVTCCAAHLAEARVFPCRRRQTELIYDSTRTHNSGLSMPDDPDFRPVCGKEEYLQSVA